MNNDLLKYINEFFNSFEKDHTFYIDGERIRFCKADDIRVTWTIDGVGWGFINKREIKEISIMATFLTITLMSGRKYIIIAKPKSKEEIISLIKNRLIRTFHCVDIKEEIAEIIYLLDGLEQHQ